MYLFRRYFQSHNQRWFLFYPLKIVTTSDRSHSLILSCLHSLFNTLLLSSASSANKQIVINKKSCKSCKQKNRQAFCLNYIRRPQNQRHRHSHYDAIHLCRISRFVAAVTGDSRHPVHNRHLPAHSHKRHNASAPHDRLRYRHYHASATCIHNPMARYVFPTPNTRCRMLCCVLLGEWCDSVGCKRSPPLSKSAN